MKRFAPATLFALVAACGGGGNGGASGGRTQVADAAWSSPGADAAEAPGPDAAGGDDAPPDAATAIPDAAAPPAPDAAGGGGGDGLMDPDERAAAASAAFEHLLELTSQGLARDDVAARMVAFMLADPAFGGAGYSAAFDNVWATFRDGVPFIIFDNLRPSPDVVPAPSFKLPIDTVPRGTQYRILRSIGDAYSANEAATKVLLDRAGYRPAARMSDQVEALLTDVHDDGFFMWATHAGEYAYARDGKTLLFGLGTTTLATARNQNSEPYRSLLRGEGPDGRDPELGISFAGLRWATEEEKAVADEKGKIDNYTYIHDGILYRRYYMVNPKFIRKHFSFGENSLVIINACTSFTEVLRSAFGAAGASTYIGWTRPTSQAGPISYLAIDRMIGGSSAPPVPKPPQRPFDIASVFAWMKAQGLSSYSDPKHGKVELEYVPLRGTYGVLAPSVKSIEISESGFKGSKGRIVVSGIFGTLDEARFPRELLVGGAAQTITGGDDLTIEGQLDASAMGETIVKVGGRKSNGVPITAWNIPVKVKATTSGSAQYTVDMNLLIRADVHRFRERPGGTPVGAVPSAPGPVVLLMEDSHASWSASGSWFDGLCTRTLSGSGSATLPTEVGAEYLMGLGTVSGKDLTIDLAVLVLAGQVGTDTLSCPDGGGFIKFPIVVPPALRFQLDPGTFEIVPGSTPFSLPPFAIEATWPATAPFYPPTGETPS